MYRKCLDFNSLKKQTHTTSKTESVSLFLHRTAQSVTISYISDSSLPRFLEKQTDWRKEYPKSVEESQAQLGKKTVYQGKCF